MKKLIFTLIASAATVGTAQAQTSTVGRPYIGVGVAAASHDYSVGGVGGTTMNKDDWKASAKVFGGYEFTQNLGVEVGYTDFRSSKFSYTRNGNGVTGYSEGYGSYVAAKYNMPLNEQFSAYGKLGAAYSNRKAEASDGLRLDESDTGVYGALGVEYKLNQKVAVIGEYERYGKDKDFGAKPDVVTFGVKYTF
ncbi:MAG: porin family protein [Telluria sp.]